MTAFWNIWAVGLTLLFLGIMGFVIFKYWRNNKSADKDKTIDTFDGIDENDAPPPRILFIAYLAAFAIAAVFLVLYPGLGNWQGAMGWKQSDDALSSPTTDLEIEMVPLTDKSLLALASNKTVTISGKSLFENHCAACHITNAQGQKSFPNLIDNEWLYGGSQSDILHSIKKGRNGAMPGWKGILS